MIAMMLFIIGSVVTGYKIAEKAGILRSIPVNSGHIEQNEIHIPVESDQGRRPGGYAAKLPRVRRHLAYGDLKFLRHRDTFTRKRNDATIEQNVIYHGSNDKFIEDISRNNAYDDTLIDPTVNINIENNAMNTEKNTRYVEYEADKFKNTAKYIRKIAKFKTKATTLMTRAYKVAKNAGILRSIPLHREQTERPGVHFGVTYVVQKRIRRHLAYEDLKFVRHRDIFTRKSNDATIEQNVIFHGSNDKFIQDITIHNAYDDTLIDPAININIDSNAINIEKNTRYIEDKAKNFKNTAIHIRKIAKYKSKTTTPMTPSMGDDDMYLAIFRPPRPDSTATVNAHFGTRSPPKYSRIRKISVSPKSYFKSLIKFIFK